MGDGFRYKLSIQSHSTGATMQTPKREGGITREQYIALLTRDQLEALMLVWMLEDVVWYLCAKYGVRIELTYGEFETVFLEFAHLTGRHGELYGLDTDHNCPAILMYSDHRSSGDGKVTAVHFRRSGREPDFLHAQQLLPMNFLVESGEAVLVRFKHLPDLSV
ncbi:MAG: hypothetical protein AB200_01855 [Parcubacteria bacterium C7867-005]|nr:MAG: hypothetical protein AB200_01855 [Parcubacteria bacterium C7867-005]